MTKKPSLAETHPELAAQADGWDPSEISGGMHVELPWICESNHSFSSRVDQRTRGRGCPFCAGKKILVGFNDLASQKPEIASQAYGWDPRSITAGSHRKLPWQCENGHIYTSQVKSRALGGRGCAICAGKKVLVGLNDLNTTHPELAAQANGWDPKAVSAGSNKKLSWRCQLGHEWTADVASRAIAKSGCNVCTGKKVVAGFNDLKTTHPEIASQADGWDPTKIGKGNDKRVSWLGECGHRWLATIGSRTYRNDACPFCSGHQVLLGFNDLNTTHPELAAQANGWDPKAVSSGSNKKLSWRCQLGHEWITTVANRTALEPTGCPTCSGKRVLVGFNDLATTHSDLANQAVGWDPRTLTAGSNKRVKWKCEFDHNWLASVDSRTRGTGCPSCAKSGFDPNKPGFLYFIDHFDLHLFQIGISNFPDNRLADHKRSGWEVIELRGPMDGHLTHELEQNCLHALEKRGAILGHKARIDKFDGYTEAWTKASLNVKSIKQILDWVYDDETKATKTL